MCNWADNKRTLGDVYSDFGNLRLTDVLPLRHTRDLGKVYTEFGNHRLIYIKDRCVRTRIIQGHLGMYRLTRESATDLIRNDVLRGDRRECWCSSALGTWVRPTVKSPCLGGLLP